ncbi:hypothetical protein J6590_002986 [Homalodisca vitripennis]|nr:hypothetical protein J6590_002986 [Homalodisca vitripennis]
MFKCRLAGAASLSSSLGLVTAALLCRLAGAASLSSSLGLVTAALLVWLLHR